MSLLIVVREEKAALSVDILCSGVRGGIHASEFKQVVLVLMVSLRDDVYCTNFYVRVEIYRQPRMGSSGRYAMGIIILNTVFSTPFSHA